MVRPAELATFPVYWTLWGLARIVGKTLFNIRFVGQQSLPINGGLLLAANHASFLDIPFLGCGVKRRLSFIGRDNLFPIPILNWLLQHSGWIPIKDEAGDPNAFRRAERLLLEGKAVVIFPEGARTKTGRMSYGKPGLGRLVAKTGCPVLPVYIGGTFEALPRGALWPRFYPVTVVFGKPIDFASERSKFSHRAFYRYVSQTVMDEIKLLSSKKEGNASPASELTD